MNEQQEVLLVKDKHEGAMWKFPGGLADLGEGIAEVCVPFFVVRPSPAKFHEKGGGKEERRIWRIFAGFS